MFNFFSDIVSNPVLVSAVKFLYKYIYIWFPIISILIIWELWVRYVQALFFAKQKYILLEIKLPREIFKSPQAAEFFIAGLYSTLGEANWYEKYWKGQVRVWHSLEITSIGGAVHFHIWTRVGEKAKIEANLYSQYPGIEIFEVPDYTLPINYDPEKYSIFATEFDLTGKDYMPIKTYVDYGLDKDPEEEYKIDPITPLIEAMGALPRGHQAWLQILIRAHKAEDKDPLTGKVIDLKWKKGAEKEISEIQAKAKGEKGEDGKIPPGSNRNLTLSETDMIKAIERSVSKNGFDAGIRMLYIAEMDLYNPSNIGGLVGGVMHFNSSLNGFKPARGSAPKYKFFALAWKDRSSKTINQEKEDLLDKYKKRAYFHSPLKSPHFVLNTEELATLFHFPGGVSMTPTFTRIESRKGEAPANLPV